MQPNKFWLSAFLSIFMAFTCFTAIQMVDLQNWSLRTPYWDQAAHALDAIHFARALRQLSLGAFFKQLDESAMWPPVVPLLQTPFLLLFGETVATIRSWMAFASIPAVALVFLVGTKLEKRLGFLIGASAAALLAVSPGYLDYCMQEMLEIPGIVLSMLCIYFYFNYLDTKAILQWKLCCLSGSLLFFSKFNYAVLIMLPIMVSQYVLEQKLRATLRKALFTFIHNIKVKSPFGIFVVAYTLLLLYIAKIGIRFEWMGHKVFIERAFGNPLYLLALIVLVRALIFSRPLLATYYREIRNAQEPLASLLRFCILPAGIWLLYPKFFKTFFIFLFSEKTRHQSFFSLETLSFYPGSVVNIYTPHPILGVLVLGSIAASLLTWRRLNHQSRFLLGLTLFNLLLTLTHPNYQERYLLATLPMMFLVTGLFIATLLDMIAPKALKFVVPLSLVAAVSLLSGFAPSKDFLQKSFDHYSQSPKVGELFQAICKEVNEADSNTVVGFNGILSPSGIGLECYKMYPNMKRSQLPVTIARHGFFGATNAQAILDSHKISQYFVFDASQLGYSVGRLQDAPVVEGLNTSLPLRGDYEGKLIIDQGVGGFKIFAYRLKTAPNKSS